MRRSATALAAGVAGTALAGALGPGLAGSASATTPPLTVSLHSNGTSLATWSAAGNPVLTAGSAAGDSAQIRVVNPPTAALTQEPTFTPSTYGGGDPRWVLEFHNGCYLFGTPNEDNTAANDWSANPGGPQGTSYATALAWAQACGTDDEVTSVFVVDDAGYAGHAVTLANVTYNGETLSGNVGRISNFNSHKCLDVTAGAYAAGTKLQQWACGASGGANQNFGFASVNGTPVLQAVTSGTGTWCVTDPGSNAQAMLSACTGVTNQALSKKGPFYYIGTGGRVLDDAGRSLSNGAKVLDYTYNGGTNQQWSLP